MSELKWNWVYYPYLDAPNKQEESALKAGYIKVVIKDEADKVIAELESENESLLQQNRELCQALQVMYSKEEYDKQKFKRCLAMVKYCHESAMWLEECGVTKSATFMLMWQKRWLELADKFKEAK